MGRSKKKQMEQSQAAIQKIRELIKKNNLRLSIEHGEILASTCDEAISESLFSTVLSEREFAIMRTIGAHYAEFGYYCFRFAVMFYKTRETNRCGVYRNRPEDNFLGWLSPRYFPGLGAMDNICFPNLEIPETTEWMDFVNLIGAPKVVLDMIEKEVRLWDENGEQVGAFKPEAWKKISDMQEMTAGEESERFHRTACEESKQFHLPLPLDDFMFARCMGGVYVTRDEEGDEVKIWRQRPIKQAAGDYVSYDKTLQDFYDEGLVVCMKADYMPVVKPGQCIFLQGTKSPNPHYDYENIIAYLKAYRLEVSGNRLYVYSRKDELIANIYRKDSLRGMPRQIWYNVSTDPAKSILRLND